MNENIILIFFNKVWDTVTESLKKSGPWTLISGILYCFSKYSHFGILNFYIEYISLILFVVFGSFLFWYSVGRFFLQVKSYIRYYYTKRTLLKCSDEEKHIIASLYRDHKFKNIPLTYYGYNNELTYNALENKGIIVIKDNEKFDCTELALSVLKKEGIKLFNHIYEEQEKAKKAQHIHTIMNELTASDINVIKAIDNSCKENSIDCLSIEGVYVTPLVMLSRNYLNPKYRIYTSQTMQDLMNQNKDNSNDHQSHSS